MSREEDMTPMDQDSYGQNVQKQKQLQRSLEASKHMLYGVFGNVITMLEEFEKHELKKKKMEKKMPQSKFFIPDQSHKSFDDIKCNVEVQLLLFETLTKACPREALDEVHEEIRRRTLAWSAVREEMGIAEIQHTDHYVFKLYEILAKGKTTHETYERKEVKEETIRKGFGAFLKGNHERETVDACYKKNPEKQATAPETRSSEMYMKGANRIFRVNEDKTLQESLQKDAKMFEDQGPSDYK